MALYPHATKASMARLLRSKGYELPKIKDTQFSRLTHSFFLRWVDLNGYGHQAYYTAVCGRPYLEVDNKPVKLTMANDPLSQGRGRAGIPGAGAVHLARYPAGHRRIH